MKGVVMLECRGRVVAVMPRVFSAKDRPPVSLVHDAEGVVVDVVGGGSDALSFEVSVSDGQGVESLRMYPRALCESMGMSSAATPGDLIGAARGLVGSEISARVSVRAFSRRDGGAGFSLSAVGLSVCGDAGSRRAA